MSSWSEYVVLVQAFVTKNNGLQPAAATVAARVGELRRYVEIGPLQPLDMKKVQRERDKVWVAKQLDSL